MRVVADTNIIVSGLLWRGNPRLVLEAARDDLINLYMSGVLLDELEDVNTQAQFVVCINNEGYPASLELRKIYRILPDERAMKHSLMRVVDESGEDYLYPERFFVPIQLPRSVMEALVQTA